MKKKFNDEKEQEVLNDISNLLQETLTISEQKILIESKRQLEEHKYFPKIIKDLENHLTHIAAKKNLKMLANCI